MTDVQCKMGDKIVVKDYEGVVPEGKVFQCWNTREDGTGINVKPGKTISVYGDMRLYPVWRDAE